MPLIYLGVFNGFLAGGGGASGVEKRISSFFVRASGNQKSNFLHPKSPPMRESSLPTFFTYRTPPNSTFCCFTVRPVLALASLGLKHARPLEGTGIKTQSPGGGLNTGKALRVAVATEAVCCMNTEYFRAVAAQKQKAEAGLVQYSTVVVENNLGSLPRD
jgi:hypothetical protein